METISCWEIRRIRSEGSDLPACCLSCHVDHEDFDYGMCVVKNPFTGNLGDHFGGVCCTMKDYLYSKPLTKEEWKTLPNES